MGCGYRVRSAKAIVEEMKYLAQNYNVEYIHFGDDAFFCSVAKMKEFCKEIFAMQYRSDFKWNMTWSCAGRANVMNKDMASMMKDAGCVGVCYGFESGSQEMLDVMNKHVILDNYRRAVEISKEYFVYEDYTFMINMFGETDETVQESIDFCKEVDIVPSAVFFTTVYPGTKMFEMLVEQGKIFPNDYAWMEKYILCLDEQGEDMKWSDMLWWSKYSVDHVKQWHKEFIGKTNAWNKEKHV